MHALVGRAALLDELAGLAAGAAAGRGAVVLLAGEAGIGKTSVAHAVAGAAGDELAVTWGACAPDHRAPPLWPWSALVDLEPVAPAPATGQAVGGPRHERLNALRADLLRRAEERPRLHVIEDIQWADVASVLLLAHLATAIGAAPFLVVATMRTGEPRPAALDAALEELRRAVTVRELAAFDDTDVAEVLRAAAVEPEASIVELVLSRTGGNPLFVSELAGVIARGRPDRRLESVAATVPDRVADLVVHRLARLPEAVADALATAAVLGADGDLGTLAAAHGTDPTALLDLLEQARAAHVLDTAGAGRWRFRHQLVRDAVYAGVVGSDRARRHARALDALAATPAALPSAVAHHALSGLPVVDADRAVALAARAGETAFAQHAYEEAIDWVDRALDAAPAGTTPRWRAELLVLRGEASRHVGDLEGARRAFVEAAGLTDEPALVARAALGYADPGADLGIAYRTHDAVTADLLERAIAAQPSLDSVTGVRLEARLAAELYFSDEPERARVLASSALARAERLDDDRARGFAGAVAHDAFVVGQVDLAEQLAGSARLLDRARGTGSVSALLAAHRARVLDLLAAGDTNAMDAEIVAFRRLAEPLRAPGYLWWPALWSAMRALLDGRHDEAERRAHAAHALGEGSFPMLAFLNLTFLLFFLRREQGRLAELEQPTRDFAAANADVPAFRVSLAFLLAEQGKLDESAAALAAFDDEALAALRDRNWPASWFQLARAAALTRDRDLAARLLDRRPTERCVQVSLATACLGATDLATAWLRHAVGDLDGADAAFRAAADTNARIGARCWLAQTRFDHARLLRARDRDGDEAEADGLHDLAVAAARELGLAPVTEAAAAGEHAGATATLERAGRFRRDGAAWELAFAGRSVSLPDARGLRDVAYLLGRPGVAVSVLELEGGPEGATGARGAPALDERARRDIRARLLALDEEEADAEAAGDGERAALARERRQELAEAVARDFGLGGRSRLVGDPVERARKTVSTRIRRTITTIGRSHPELGRHLERSVDTGAWCAYRPAEPVAWET